MKQIYATILGMITGTLIVITIFTVGFMFSEKENPQLIECIDLNYTYRGGQVHTMKYCFDNIENYSTHKQTIIKQFNENHIIDSTGICCKGHRCYNNKFTICSDHNN